MLITLPQNPISNYLNYSFKYGHTKKMNNILCWSSWGQLEDLWMVFFSPRNRWFYFSLLHRGKWGCCFGLGLRRWSDSFWFQPACWSLPLDHPEPAWGWGARGGFCLRWQLAAAPGGSGRSGRPSCCLPHGLFLKMNGACTSEHRKERRQEGEGKKKRKVWYAIMSLLLEFSLKLWNKILNKNPL